jgi:protocatechuate 3,4-dioxygenase beta subunit
MRLLIVVAALATLAQGPPPGVPGGGRGQIRPGMPPRAGVPQEEGPKGTAIIRGVVLAADTGTPIRRAQVRASAAAVRTSRLATTDAQGRFEFRDLPGGRYTISASKGGFVGLQYGQRRPSESGTPLEIADAQVMDKLVLALPRGSVISGRIFDEFGEPIANAVVNALRYGYAGGARRFMPAGGQNARDTTDDQGQFRLFGLPPGEYLVSANFRGGGGEVTDPAAEPSGYAPTYFPGTPSAAEAQRVRVDIGQEQNSVNFALIATRLVRITGSVIDSKGAPVTAGMLTLMQADLGRGPMQLGNSATRVDRNGTFRITDVAPGRYVLQTRTNMGGPGGRGGAAAGAGAEPEFARVDLAVGAQDVDGVVLVTAPGARATGQVVTDSPQAAQIRPDQIAVGARSARPDQPGFGGGAGNARVNADWTFAITGLFDPVLFRVNAPQGWALKQVLLNTQDITDTPLEFTPGQTVSGLQIVLTDKLTTVIGAVTNTRGQAVTDATIVVFPADEKLWMFQSRYIRAARPDQDGRYTITGLPAYDDYLIVAVQGLEDGQAGDPEFLAGIKGGATALRLNEGETKSADIKLATGN